MLEMYTSIICDPTRAFFAFVKIRAGVCDPSTHHDLVSSLWSGELQLDSCWTHFRFIFVSYCWLTQFKWFLLIFARPWFSTDRILFYNLFLSCGSRFLFDSSFHHQKKKSLSQCSATESCSPATVSLTRLLKSAEIRINIGTEPCLLNESVISHFQWTIYLFGFRQSLKR